MEYTFSDGEGKVFKKKDKSIVRDPKNTDRRILIFFSIWFVFAIIISVIVGIVLGIDGLYDIISVLVVLTIIAFFNTGILAYIYFRKRAIRSTKWLFIKVLKISLVLGLVFAVVMFFLLTQQILLDNEPIEGDTATFVLMFLGLYLGGFLVAFFTFLLFLFFGFGIIAVLSALVRAKTPDMLVEITKITKNLSDSEKKKDKRKFMGFAWLGWAFGIPNVLDTSTLTIKEDDFHEGFPKKEFKKAVYWQLFFGMILVVYISFSPFLLDYANMQQLYSIAVILTTFIPLLILPWFIYLKLDAKISGPIKDFMLFDGLSSRMFQTLVAFGTLLLLVRMAIRNPEFMNVMSSFVIFFIFFISGIIIVTFVYFNYFEDDLASDIAKKYMDLKEHNPK